MNVVSRVGTFSFTILLFLVPGMSGAVAWLANLSVQGTGESRLLAGECPGSAHQLGAQNLLHTWPQPARSLVKRCLPGLSDSWQ